MTAPTLQLAFETPLTHTTILAIHHPALAEAPQVQTFHFPKGIFGFREVSSFDLKPFGRDDFAPLKIFHASGNPYVSFVVAPFKSLTDLSLPRHKLQQMGTELHTTISLDNLHVILTLHKTGNGLRFTANMKAPLVLFPEREEGYQYLFSDTLNSFAEALPALDRHFATITSS